MSPENAKPLGQGEAVQLAIPVLLPREAGGRGTTWIYGLPFIWLWRRRQRRQVRAATSSTLGLDLAERMILAVTQHELLFWSAKAGPKKQAWLPQQLIGRLDRSAVASVSNNSSGQGWRTCRVVLTDGTESSLRVSHRDVEAFVALFAESQA